MRCNRTVWSFGPAGASVAEASASARWITFSKTCSSGSNPLSRSENAAESATAAWGTRPTISLETTSSPYREASARVTSVSMRFIETVRQSRSGAKNPIARTLVRPPEDSRTRRAIALADSSSRPPRYTLNATSGLRAPTATAPARPISWGPKSGSRRPAATSAFRPSYSPLRTSARLRRSEESAARS